MAVSEILGGLLLAFLPFAFIIGFFVILGSIKIIMQYEKGLVFTLGKFTRILHPGLNIIIPIFQSMQKVDIRIKTIDVPKQEVMTADNVPIMVNAVIYFRIQDAEKAILNIEDYMFAVSQFAQTALRDVIGGIELDYVLTKREEIAKKIREIVDRETDAWGIDVTSLKMQDVELPENLKRTMAKQAEAEREKRGVIIKAEGEVMAANNLAKAAKTIATSPGAMHLRTLSTLNDLSSDQSNTVVFAIPIEVLQAIEGFTKNRKSKL